MGKPKIQSEIRDESKSSFPSAEQPEKAETHTKETPFQIIVAKIGVWGTVAAALISTMGVIISAYFGYLGVKAQITVPAEETSAHPTDSIATTVVPTSLSYATMIARSSTPSPTQTSTPTPTSSPSLDEWVKGWIGSEPCSNVFVPVPVGTEVDKLKLSVEEFFSLMENAVVAQIIDGTPKVFLLVTIQSKADKEWIKIPHKITVLVRVEEAPEFVTGITMEGGCGGGVYRHFSTVPLKSDVEQYFLKVEAKDSFDFYILEPGEFEHFIFDFECREPGLYRILLQIPATIGEQGFPFILSDATLIVCPQEASLWAYYGVGIVNPAGRYRWVDERYEVIEP